jgi:hypothetical protein
MQKASLQRAMGIRRPFRTKIWPWLLLISVYVPVVVLIGIAVLARSSTTFTLPTSSTYAGFYNGISLALILFAGTVAPDLLCPDRRERVLSLYFVAPITRLHYLAARFGAVVELLLAMSLVPAILFFVASASLGSDAVGFIGDHLNDLWHVAAAGAFLAVYYGIVATAVAAFHDRRAYAVGTYAGLLLVSAAAGGILSGKNMHFAGHKWFVLLNLLSLPLEVVNWMFGQKLSVNLDAWAYVAASVAVIGISGALVIWQYRRLEAI